MVFVVVEIFIALLSVTSCCCGCCGCCCASTEESVSAEPETGFKYAKFGQAKQPFASQGPGRYHSSQNQQNTMKQMPIQGPQGTQIMTPRPQIPRGKYQNTRDNQQPYSAEWNRGKYNN